MGNHIRIGQRDIGKSYPAFIIAEISANHNQRFEYAVELIKTAKNCGADAVKLQTYTPDTITIDSENDYFKIKGTIWEGETLYNLYKKAYTPWEWQPKLKAIADELRILLFSTPFDRTSVDFLEKMDVPAYKVASFELVDIPLIEYIARKGKPIIISTGMANIEETSHAVRTVRGQGLDSIALLKCTSSYPADADDMNLITIDHLAKKFDVVAGLSDHSLEFAVPVAAVALGASIIEKHLTLSRADGGPDADFSLEPNEFRKMIDAVRVAEKAIGTVNFNFSEKEGESRILRRSLFVVKDIEAGEEFSEDNIRSIRPGHGLEPKHLSSILGRKSNKNILRGTPLFWDCIDE